MSFRNSIYSVLFEAIQEGLIVVDSNSEIVLCNSVCTKLFGYSESELIGQKIELLVPAAARSKHVEKRNSYHKKPSQRSMGNNLKLNGERKDGSVFPVEVSLNPFKDNGEPFVAALVSDVTIRRKTEDQLLQLTQNLEEKVANRTKELWQSEQLYKSIARNFPGGVISIFDRSLKYLFAEGQGLYELGIETEDLIGYEYLERLAPEARNKVKEELESVFLGDHRTFEIKVNQGTYLINAVPLTNEKDEIDRILVVEKNITSQKEVAERLEENLQTERELNEMKSRFVSMASHEFRTPLTTINSSAGLILKYHEKGQYDKTPKHVGRIKASVRNLTTILNDFLSLEKLESGKTEAKISKVDVVGLIQEVVDEMEGFKKENQHIKCELPTEFIFNTDAQLIKNVIINLISNALKYSNEDGDVIVSLSKSDDNGVLIEVEDFGIGIPVADQAKMFDRFFRAGNVTNIEGTGLGLNIVVKYLDLLGGKLSFKSEENKGTVFKVELPEYKMI